MTTTNKDNEFKAAEAGKDSVGETRISPVGIMDILSKAEQAKLLDRSLGGLHEIFRNCSLAVLNCGGVEDDTETLLARHKDFSIEIAQRERGIKLEIKNAPAQAFVDGKLIKGIQEHLSSVLRDILFLSAELEHPTRFDLCTGEGTTDAVFHILRNAGALEPALDPNLVVCWGGHSIVGHEYDYTKKVGYELGLRAMDICTGCGPGAMKGPMKGATIGHAKQRGSVGRYFGFTEPGIIAAESPNPIVNRLVILPDIEKRLEAFVRAGHGVIVFPGGAGTAEEILYILGVLMHPDNEAMPFPLIFTGPKESASYFERIDAFLRSALGEKACSRYRIIVDDPVEVARAMQQGIKDVRAYRKETGDAYYFNWGLKVDRDFQKPFEPTHEAMAALRIEKSLPAHELAAQLRRVFSGIVAGNVKADGVASIRKHGPFVIKGDKAIMDGVDELLRAFAAQGRMKLGGVGYVPCYKLEF